MTTLVIANRGLLKTHSTALTFTPAEARQWGLMHLRQYAESFKYKRTRRAQVFMHDDVTGIHTTLNISYTP